MRIGLLGTLAVHDEAGRPVRVGGYRVRMLLILLALDAGRVVPTYSLIETCGRTNRPSTQAIRYSPSFRGCAPRCGRLAWATM